MSIRLSTAKYAGGSDTAYDEILERLALDPGERTLGQLLQDREAAAHEIRRLRAAMNPSSAQMKAAEQAVSPQVEDVSEGGDTG